MVLVPKFAMTQTTADVKTIVGKWSGTGFTPGGTQSLTWTIKEDGTVAALVQTPQGPREGAGKISVKDGKFFYESGASSGPVTISETGDRRTLKYDATMKRDGGRGGAELTLEK
jgi:hypothetical protein